MTHEHKTTEECGAPIHTRGFGDMSGPITCAEKKPCAKHSESPILTKESVETALDTLKNSAPKKGERITIVPSGRIDYCSACKKDHGYDCPLEVQDKPELKDRIDEFWYEHDGEAFYKDELIDFVKSERQRAVEEYVAKVKAELQSLPGGHMLHYADVIGLLDLKALKH